MAKNKSLFSEDEYKALLGTLNQHQEVALEDNLATNENTSDLDYKDNFDQFTVKFDSTFNIGGEQDLYINQEANKEINKILEKDGAVAIQGINNETSTLIRKNTDDKNYQDYQKINNHVLKNLENNTNFMEYVPQVRREELSHYLTNKIYGFQKNIKDKLPVNVSPNALEEMSLVAQDYTDKYILPLGNHLANKQASDFQDSTPGDAFRKGLYEYFSNINKGVAGRVSQFEFTGGEDGRLAKFFQKGADKAQSWAEEMDPPKGIYTLSAQEIANTSKEELGNIDRSIITLSRAWGSSGQQALGVANTISMMTPARLGVRGALTGANIASNLFAESGAFEQGIKQEYDNLKIKALEQRDKLDYDEFKSLFSIDVDGKMKTIDEVDDKKIRELSRKVATNYAATSTALEGLSLFMDRKLGAPAKGILKSMQNNPALTSKLWFNRFGRLGKNISAEGLTEGLQEFASEHYKEMKLPQYEKDWDAILESGKIGAVFGAVQFGGDKLLRSVTDQTFSYSENTRSKETQYAIDRLVQERQRRNLGDFSKPKHQIHNALVVGNDKDPLTFKKKIADHYKMDIEEVEAIHDEARSNDLDFSEKAVDKALKTNPEFNELFDIDKNVNIESDLNQDGEIDGFNVDQQVDGNIDQELSVQKGNRDYVNDNVDEQAKTQEGLDYQEGVDDQLASTMLNKAETKLEELKKTPTGTNLSVAQKKGRISALEQQIAELRGDLKNPNQNKKKRQTEFVKKAKKVQEKKKPKDGFTVSEVKGKNRRLKKQAILESRTQYSREDILEMDDEKTNEVFYAISDKNASSRLRHIKNAIKTAEKKKAQKKPKVSKNLKNLSKLKNSSEEVQIKEPVDSSPDPVNDYINAEKLVQFPVAKSKKEQMMIVEGKTVKPTNQELNKLEQILKDQRQGGSYKTRGDLNLRKLAVDVLKRVRSAKTKDADQQSQTTQDFTNKKLIDYKKNITKITLEERIEIQRDVFEEDLKSGKKTEADVIKKAKESHEYAKKQLKDFEKNPLSYMESDLESTIRLEKQLGEDLTKEKKEIKALIVELRKELEEKLSKSKVSEKSKSNVDAMLEGDTLVEKKKKPTKKRVQEKKEAVLEGVDDDYDVDSEIGSDKQSENTVVAKSSTKSSVDQSILDQIKKDREKGNVNKDNPNQDVEKLEQELNEAREIYGAGGKVLRDNPKDIKSSTDENGRLKQTVYGETEAKMHAQFDKKWAMLKKRGDYTESQFSEFVEKHDADMRANSLFALNWISWVKRRRPLSKTQEKIESAKMLAQSLGARLTLNKTKGAVEDLDIFEETSEVYREGIGEEETAGVSEPKLSVNDFSKIAKSFFVENNFKVNTIDMNKLIEKARSLVFTDEPVSFQEFIDEIGSTEGLVDQNNKTFIQLMQSPQIRQSFKRYYLSMHIDNVGSVNNGINKGNPNSEIIQLEAKINENHAFDEESDKTPYQQVRITPEIGLNNRVRPSQAVKMLYTRYIKDVEGGPVVRLATLSKRDLHSVKWTAQGINPNTGLLYHTPIKTMYKFLNTTAMIKLWKTIHQSHKNNKNSIMDMIPISTRGENTKILFAGITKQIRNTDKKQYFLNEVEHYKEIYTDKSEEDVLKLVADVIGGIYSTKRLPQSEQIILEEVYNGDTAEFKNGLMAKHQALTALFGREYISLPIPKLMQRIKIPTTPVYTSPTLPPRKIMFFDPEGTSLEIIDSRTGLQLHSPKQKTLIDNTMQYIRDGKLITSEHVFKTQYPEHFGNPASAMRLKTVHASNDQQGNVYMSKHDEKTLALRNVNYEANLLDKDGNVIALFRRRGDGRFLNIYEPSDTAFENPIDYIGTDDEAKIRFGDLKENNVVHTVPGSSVGIIKYTSKKIKNYSMISTQLAQYQTDPEFQSFLMKEFNNDKSSYLSPKKLATKLLNMADNPKKINDFIKELARHYPDVVTSNVEGLGQLGVGNHPTSIAFLKNIIKNKILRPINKFHVQGTYLDFNSDDIGDVKRDEIIMPNEKNLMFKILNLIEMDFQTQYQMATDTPSNLDEKINFINNWLKDNKVHVMVTRSPITNKDGWGLYKIKEISNQIGDSFIINNNETKERFEGDNDQDNGHIIYLDENQYKFLKKFYDPKIQGLNLAQYKTSPDERNTGSMYDTLKGAEDMTYGSTAIGEVVSIARYAGLLNSFGKNNSTITLRVSDGDPNDTESGTNIRVAFRGLDEIIEDPKMVKKDGTYFKGTLGDYLRTYLQAAVDHPKVLLLNEWEYDRDTLIRKLFYFPDPSQDEMVKEMALTGMTRGFIKKVLNLTSNISNMRTDSQDQASFENIFEYSRTYHDFIKDRKAWLTDALNWGVNDEPAPMYSNEFGEVEVVDVDFFQNKGSSNLIERTSVIYDQIKNRVRMDPDSPVSQFFNVDPELNKLTHIKALNELRPYFEETIQGFTGQINEKQIQEARTYASQLQTELYNSVNKVERVKEGEYADKINANSFDHSDVFMKLNEKYVEKYSQLTDGQKHIATFAFLRGLAIESSNTGKLNIRKSMNVLPPVTNDENNTTLKPEVVKEYFKEWNKVFQSFKANHKATMKKNRLKAPDYLKQSREILNCG